MHVHDFAHLTLFKNVAGLLRSGEIWSVELTQAALERVRAVDEHVDAFLLIAPDVALAQARQADALLARGAGNPLTGVPMGMKDVLSTRGVPTTCGSRMLASYVPQYDATVVRRLFEHGAVMVGGKTNMDEFAMGCSTENSAFDRRAIPGASTRPGGSSGGSAAAVAAGEVLSRWARTPAARSVSPPRCAACGLKPTYGRVSRYGLVAFASSLDQIGPFTRTVEDAALVLSAIAGHDPAGLDLVPRARARLCAAR